MTTTKPQVHKKKISRLKSLKNYSGQKKGLSSATKQSRRRAQAKSANLESLLREQNMKGHDKVDCSISHRRSSDPELCAKADKSKPSPKKEQPSVGFTDKNYVPRKLEDGIRQARKGKYVKARRSYLAALSRTDDEKLKVQIYLAVANILVSQRFDKITLEKDKLQLGMEAISNFKKAIAILSKSSEREILNVRAMLGNILYSMEYYGAACKQYAQAATDISTIDTCVLAQMLYNYAMIKFKDEEYEKVQSLLTEVLEYKNDCKDPIFHIPQYDIVYYLGISFFKLGDYDMAANALVSFLEESEKISNPVLYDVGRVHFCLAKIYEREGDKNNNDLALKHYTEYLDEKDPKLTILLMSENHVEQDLEGHLIDVFASMGHLHMKSGNFTIAGNCFREAYYGAKLIPDKDDLSLYALVREAYECYTKTNFNLNRYSMLQEIISISERIQNVDQLDSRNSVFDEQMANYYDALGQLNHKSDEIESALKSFRQCLRLRERYLMQADPILAKLRCKIAFYFYKLDDFNKALEYCEITCNHSNDLNITKKALCMKGKIYARKRDKDNCVLSFNEAISLWKGLGKQYSSDLSETYELFAQAHFELDCFEESVDCFHQAYRLRSMSAETKPGECLAIMHGLVDAYKVMKKYKLALLTSTKILSTQKKINLPHSDDQACTMEIMGDLHAAIGGKSDYFNAVELYRLSAKIMRKNHGCSNESLLMIYLKMANVLGLKLNEHEKALKLFRVVASRPNLEREDDRSHFIVLGALEGQGDVLSLQSEYISALHKYESSMKYADEVASNKARKEEIIDPIRDTRVGMFCKIGRTYKSMKKYDLALRYLGDGLDMMLQLDMFPTCPDNTTTARFFFEIGLVHLKLKDSETALEKLNRASELIEAIPELDSEGASLANDIERQLNIIESKSMLSFVLCK